MKTRQFYIWVGLACLGLVTVFACQNMTSNTQAHTGTDKEEITPKAKFEPSDNKILLFAGQELEAIGGTDKYSNGYFNHFAKPAGFTMYTGFAGTETEGTGLQGLYEPSDVGAGINHIELLTKNKNFNNTILAIGLSMVNEEHNIAEGFHDDQIYKLGGFIKSLDKRPVFLRIGYEFDGEWNHYDSASYIGAFRRIKDKLDSLDINNVAYIWQATGWGSSKEQMMKYYPGDNYVDWCSFSYFGVPEGELYNHEPMLTIAREKSKPVFIAESTPMLDVPADNKSSAYLDLSIPNHAQRAWNEWFIPYFKMIEKNKDVVKAVHYINCNWQGQPMWQKDSPFSRIDARLSLNDSIANSWREETNKDLYVKSYDKLYDDLWTN